MLTILVAVAVVLFVWLMMVSKRKMNHWKSIGIPYIEPIPIFGNYFKVFTFQKNLGEFYRQVYEEHPDKDYVGVYVCNKPMLVVRNPELIGRILVKEFGHFIDHGLPDFSKTKADAILFFLEGNLWRAMRLKMIPAFTTGKLRNMFPEMVKCTQRIMPLIEANRLEVDIAEVSSAYVMNMIASCAFGIEIPADASTEFRRMGKQMFRKSLLASLGDLIVFGMPKLAEKLNLEFTPRHVADYYYKIIKDTMDYRIKNNVMRNDFIQLLIELKQKGSVEFQSRDLEDDDYLKADIAPPTTNIEVTEELLISQSFVFLSGGFEPVTLTIMYTFLDLAQDQRLQDRVRRELKEMIKKHDGITYDALKESVLLGQCVSEALRKHPLAPILFRVCNKRFELNDGVHIEPGTSIVIPITGLHNDHKYWNEPEKYDPERFNTNYTPYTYLPFSEGPRMCIGMRFALLEVKLGVAAILNEYKLELNPKTILPLKTDIRSIVSIPEESVLFTLTKI